jgi:hypothetical protein
VKKIISILILATYLCSYTELKELLKLPLLFTHYTEHSSHDQNLSFADFLSMHYHHEHDNDGDDADDRSLPFKSHDNCVHSSSINFFAQTNEIYIKPIETELAITQTQEKEFFYPSFSANIWQPPKL